MKQGAGGVATFQICSCHANGDCIPHTILFTQGNSENKIEAYSPPHSPYAQTPILSFYSPVCSLNHPHSPAKHFLPACHIPHHVCVGDRAPDRLTDGRERGSLQAGPREVKLDAPFTDDGGRRRLPPADGRRDGGDSVGYEGRATPFVRAGGAAAAAQVCRCGTPDLVQCVQ